MLTPRELYNQYTSQIYNDIHGKGTPYDLVRLVYFLKHLKTPCYRRTLNSIVTNPNGTTSEQKDTWNTITDTGLGKLGIPFKFLTRIDAEAFEEIQPSMDSGTAFAVRNSCDLTRACDTEIKKAYDLWEARMATEYLQRFAGNSLPDCLLMLGPDLVSEDTALNRSTGCGDLSCITNTKFEDEVVGAIGAPHSCMRNKTGKRYCGSCGTCDIDPEEDPVGFANNPCCTSPTCEDKINKCCHGPLTLRFDFTYLQRSDDSLFGGTVNAGWVDSIFKHIGIIKRKSYGGYANFIDSSGSNFYASPDNVFLRYMQSQNGYDYTKDTSTSGTIDRIKTICGLFGDTETIVKNIKDLLFNGYGVVLFTNVGFPDIRDSTGLSYPDRNWYHTYSIIAYDDRKTEFKECVFLLANSWGEWNSGGNPTWGPIPPGSFLVTESHLKCMLDFNRAPDYKGCKSQFCPPPCPTPEDFAACTDEGTCVPFECTDKQKAFGLAFALSMKEGFLLQKLDYDQFTKPILPVLDGSIVYFNPN
jgi:hypothetical protein